LAFQTELNEFKNNPLKFIQNKHEYKLNRIYEEQRVMNDYYRSTHYIEGYDNSMCSENTTNLGIMDDVKCLLKLAENILEDKRCTIQNINLILSQ